jgi:DNA polymerase-3 subunit epsilon
VTEADRAAHREFVLTLGDKPIWNDFLNDFLGASPSLA